MPVPRIFGKKPVQGILVGLTGAFLAIALWATAALDPWEAKTWDWRAALLAAPGAATDRVALILLDQNSLDWARKENGLTWPWPREVYGAIVDFCRRSGARALAFDVLYTEPSKYGVEDDAAFGRSAKAFGRFAASVFLGESSGSETRWPASVPVPGFKILGLDRWLERTGGEGIAFSRATLPIPELAAGAKVLCDVHMTPDRDGIYRKIRLFSLFDGKVLPVLGLGAYLAEHPDTPMTLGPKGLTVGERIVPVDANGEAILRYRGPSGTHRTFSAAAVLQSELRLRAGESPTIRDPAALRGKYVFFGFSAPGLYDLRPSPVDGIYPGVEIHATVLDNLLSGDFIRPMPDGISAALVILIALAVGVAASSVNRVSGGVAVGIVSLASPILLSVFFYLRGYSLPLVVQEIGTATSLALAFGVNYATEGRQKRFIKNAFRQYLSPAVIEELIQHPERLKLGGERRVLSIFFSDLQGFTSISEGLEPEALTALLNDYLTAMTDIIHAEGGTVDKYEGDAIIAFWNAPLSVPDHGARIVRAALRCQQSLAELRPVFRERIGKEMFMRIGVNTGPAVVGNLGSHTRFDYTMLGDAVNLAARLEGANKQFGTFTMISEATRREMGEGFAVRELARVAVVGRAEPVTVFEPMEPGDYAARRTVLETFSNGLRHYYGGRFGDAVALFDGIRDQDPPAAAYARKCRQLAEEPPADWKGIWVMTRK